jgi:hypothetical protein
VVKQLLDEGKRVVVERQVTGQTSPQTQTLEVDCEDVHDAAATGMMRLLARVRHAFIPLTELRTRLSYVDLQFSCKHSCF